MEFLRGLPASVRERILDRLDPPGSRWSQQESDAYLKLLVREGRRSVAFFDEFPFKLALMPAFHEVMDTLRAKAKQEGKERWSLIGYMQDRNRVYVQVNGSLGERGRISQELRRSTIEAARSKGIVGRIGSIHSHFRQEALFEDEGGFSAEDLFILLIPNGDFLKAVVEPDANYFAFKTFETKNVPSDPFPLTQEAFARLWYEECGYSYGGTSASGSRIVRSFQSLLTEEKDVVEAIAERHKLVVYKGEPDRALRRIFPRLPS